MARMGGGCSTPQVAERGSARYCSDLDEHIGATSMERVGSVPLVPTCAKGTTHPRRGALPRATTAHGGPILASVDRVGAQLRLCMSEHDRAVANGDGVSMSVGFGTVCRHTAAAEGERGDCFPSVPTKGLTNCVVCVAQAVPRASSRSAPQLGVLLAEVGSVEERETVAGPLARSHPRRGAQEHAASGVLIVARARGAPQDGEGHDAHVSAL